MNNLTETTKLTKSIILDELTKIIIDHTIPIEPELLKQKVNLLYNDCASMTAECFIANANFLRKKELFGRLPANHEFISPKTKPRIASNGQPSYLDYLTGGKNGSI